ncbi:hypothetical protein ABIB34_004266 [Rhodococcus sp. UYP5]
MVVRRFGASIFTRAGVPFGSRLGESLKVDTEILSMFAALPGAVPRSCRICGIDMGSERGHPQPRTDLPVLQWIPRWPQRIQWTGFSSAVFIAAFAVLVFVALFNGVANGSCLATAGFAGLAIVFVIMAAHMSGIAGIRYVSLSRRVRSCDHLRYGTGVEMLRPPLLSTRFGSPASNAGSA